MNSLIVSPKELKDVLIATIPHSLPVLIKGRPGVGKTDIVSQVCEELGYQLLIAHPVVDDPTDYKGFPFVIGDRAEFIPFGMLRKLVEATEPTVFFLDDLGQAAPSVQAACMQLLLAREINGKKVSDKVVFVAATNRKSDKAGVSGILEPVKSRFVCIVQLEPTLTDWVEWALSHNVPPEVVSFIRFRPGTLDAFEATSDIVNTPCPRTIANVGKLMNAGVPAYLEQAVFAGAAGQAFAIEFCAFVDLYRGMPDIDELIKNPDSARIPVRPEILYAASSAIAYRATKENLNSIMRLLGRFPKEYEVYCLSDITGKFPGLKKTKEYVKWVTQNSEMMLA